ncbi:hypothetical protein [Carboxylicivirga sp. N1Y90]|uniref:hypothetical protein n=1 Tax=Carboxylicivirga fragile TaxID=3417571 RepID=UPI003D350884|nr:hypothetical protein [Marinilabiliaceae bacterium N1Y90]
MKKNVLKYHFLSWALLFVMLPSLIGVNIFKHHCFSCNEYETVATIMKVEHEHMHSHGEATPCCCSHESMSCCESEEFQHEHFKGTSCCNEEYKRIEVNVTVFNSIQKNKVAEIDLFYPLDLHQHSCLIADSKKSFFYQNVNLYVPDEPSLAENCVFLL